MPNLAAKASKVAVPGLVIPNDAAKASKSGSDEGLVPAVGNVDALVSGAVA
jgi:hypothetical protein